MEVAQLFPSVWDLLFPNFNVTTIIGILLIILGIVGYVMLFKFAYVLIQLGLPFDVAKASFLMIMVGFLMAWGISAFEDFMSTTGGAVVFWGTVIVVILGIVLFWKPKDKAGTGTPKQGRVF